MNAIISSFLIQQNFTDQGIHGLSAYLQMGFTYARHMREFILAIPINLIMKPPRQRLQTMLRLFLSFFVKGY